MLQMVDCCYLSDGLVEHLNLAAKQV